MKLKATIRGHLLVVTSAGSGTPSPWWAPGHEGGFIEESWEQSRWKPEPTMEPWSSGRVKTSAAAEDFPSEVAVRNSLYKIQSFWKEKYYLTHSPCDRAPDCQMTFLYWSSLKSHLGYSVLTDLTLKISLCVWESRTSLLSVCGGGEGGRSLPFLILLWLLDELLQSTSWYSLHFAKQITLLKGSRKLT